MGRKEDLNSELSSYLSQRVDFKPRKAKPIHEEVPYGITSDKVHVIEGQPSWWDRFMTKLKEKTPTEPEPEMKETSPRIEEKPEEFDKEESEFEEEKKEKGFSFKDFLRNLFGGEEKEENFDEIEQVQESQKPELSPEVKRLIEDLIRVNVDVLSLLSPEELSKFRRSESYQAFKAHVATFKQLSAPKEDDAPKVEQAAIETAGEDF